MKDEINFMFECRNAKENLYYDTGETHNTFGPIVYCQGRLLNLKSILGKMKDFKTSWSEFMVKYINPSWKEIVWDMRIKSVQK